MAEASAHSPPSPGMGSRHSEVREGRVEPLRVKKDEVVPYLVLRSGVVSTRGVQGLWGEEEGAWVCAQTFLGLPCARTIDSPASLPSVSSGLEQLSSRREKGSPGSFPLPPSSPLDLSPPFSSVVNPNLPSYRSQS